MKIFYDVDNSHTSPFFGGWSLGIMLRARKEWIGISWFGYDPARSCRWSGIVLGFKGIPHFLKYVPYPVQ